MIGLVLALIVLSGCSSSDSVGYDSHLRFLLREDPIVDQLPKTPPAELHANGKLLEAIAELKNLGGVLTDPKELSKNEREKLTALLESRFGTPAAPRLPGEPFGITPQQLATGSGLYKTKCAQCHGMNGDGRGPTGIWVYPHPRDFRLARFKYVSSSVGLPTRDDLATMIKVGINGNSMPGFALLPPEQIEALVTYTVFLSLRGRVETELIRTALSEDGYPEIPDQFVDQVYSRWVSKWHSAEARSVPAELLSRTVQDGGTSEDYDSRIRRGHAAFQTAGCASCHKDYGRETHYLYDVWGVAVRPSNLTLGVYRGGGEPTELYHRIRCGISPSGMPEVNETTLSDERVSDLILFLKALPVPRHLPPDLRSSIYR